MNKNWCNLSVFIDMSKAFDKLWIDGLLIKMHKLGISGNILNWISSFLNDRCCTVSFNGAESDIYSCANGVPQGSCLGPILFLIMMHDIPTPKGNSWLLSFADDNTLSCIGRTVDEVTSNAQRALNVLDSWCKTWGLVINATKTKAILFTKKYKVTPIDLFFQGYPIEFVPHVKYLGVWFDKGYNLVKNTTEVINKAKKRISLLKCLARYPWCNKMESLVLFYKNVIRSIIDFGSILYENASKKILGKLNQIQYLSLKICAGCYLGSSLDGLEVICNVTPLDIHLQEVNSNYFSSLLWQPRCCMSFLPDAIQVENKRSVNRTKVLDELKDIMTFNSLSLMMDLSLD